jgi:hypothetical protein
MHSGGEEPLPAGSFRLTRRPRARSRAPLPAGGRREMVTITVRSDLTRIQRTNLETCITVHMHQKESTEDLVRRKVGLWR